MYYYPIVISLIGVVLILVTGCRLRLPPAAAACGCRLRLPPAAAACGDR